MMPSTASRTETQLLIEAFDSFARISSSLEGAYRELQEKVFRLSSELEQTNYYLKAVLQSLPCGVMVISRQQSITMMNPRALQLFGVAHVQLPFPLPTFLELFGPGRQAGELLEGTGGPVEIRIPSEPERRISCFSSEMRNGERVVVLQDVTELRELELQMQKTQRLAAMAEMALEVAHEIRNPLGSLELFASLLREPCLSVQEREHYLNQMQIGIRSLNSVLTNMLAFSRQPEPRKEPVAAGQMVREIVTFMKPLLEQRGIQVTLSLRDRLEILADREMLRQLFTNLITNALQALPRGGKLRIRSRSFRKSVRIILRDTGIGIPEDLQEQIFDPGFTTNPRGNGLGLSIVQRIVSVHGGRISVKSRPGWGTEFTLRFPALGRES